MNSHVSTTSGVVNLIQGLQYAGRILVSVSDNSRIESAPCFVLRRQDRRRGYEEKRMDGVLVNLICEQKIGQARARYGETEIR